MLSTSQSSRGGFLARRRGGFVGPVSVRSRAVRDFAGLKGALHDAHVGDLSDIIIDGQIAVDETLTIAGMRHDLVIRGRGDASIYAADTLAATSPVFKLSAGSALLTTAERPTTPSVTLRDLYARTGPKFIELDDADEIRLLNVSALSSVGTDKFLDGACGAVRIEGGEFHWIDIEALRTVVHGVKVFNYIEVASAGTSSDQASFVMSDNHCNGAGVSATGTYLNVLGVNNSGDTTVAPTADVSGLSTGSTSSFPNATNLGFTLSPP